VIRQPDKPQPLVEVIVGELGLYPPPRIFVFVAQPPAHRALVYRSPTGTAADRTQLEVVGQPAACGSGCPPSLWPRADHIDGRSARGSIESDASHSWATGRAPIGFAVWCEAPKLGYQYRKSSAVGTRQDVGLLFVHRQFQPSSSAHRLQRFLSVALGAKHRSSA